MDVEPTPETKGSRQSNWGTSVLCLLCGLGFIASSLMGWWRFLDMPLPASTVAARIICFVVGVLVILGSLLRRPGTIVKWAVPIGLALPFLMLLNIGVYEPTQAMHAVKQSEELDRLVAMITRVDLEPTLPWINGRDLRSRTVIRNDFTLVDELENEAFFAQAGFFFCLFFAAILGVVVIGRRKDLLYGRPPRLWFLALLCIASGCVYGIPLGIGHLYWHLGRAAAADGDYKKSLDLFAKAIQWDKRLDYDYAFHFDLGRIYGRAGMVDQPDYWASLADIYEATGGHDNAEVDSGYNIYLLKIPDPNCNPAMAPRMANAFLREGSIRFSDNNDLEAIDAWRKAIRTDPTNLEVRWALATAYTAQGDYRDARDEWLEIIKENESAGLLRSKFVVTLTYRKTITARAWSSLAWCYYNLGDTDNAAASKFNATEASSSYLSMADD